MRDNLIKILEILGNTKIVIYGYGYYGKLLENVLSVSKYKFFIHDDKYDALESSINIDEFTVVLCASNDIVRSKMESSSRKLGFKNVVNNTELFGLLEKLSANIGYCKADESSVYGDDCPICNSQAKEKYVNHRGYSIRKCLFCNHEYVGNLPKKTEIFDFYSDIGYFEQNYKVSLDDFNNSYLTDFGRGRASMISRFLPLEIEKCKPLRILEIGCLDGRMLWYLKQYGHEVYGNEINKQVAEIAIEKLGIDIRTSLLEECGFELEYFDVIFSSHVLEHVDNIKEFVGIAKKYLKREGLFIANIPVNETDYENYHHLHFFSEFSVFRMLYDIFENATVCKGAPYAVNTQLFDTVDICARII